MEKTIRINLQGSIFSIDEGANKILITYLSHLNEYFDQFQEGKEIIKDIEIRIAEIFQNKLSKAKEAIDVGDVEEVIKMLGKPEEIIEEGEPADYNRKNKKDIKRMYRDSDKLILGGAASGIAMYFGFAPWLVRLIFILLIFVQGIGLVLYFIFWVVLPKASTYEQKLEMRGKKDPFYSVRDELVKKSSRSESIKEDENNQSPNNKPNTLNQNIGEFFASIGKIISITVGIILLIVGLLSLMPFMSTLIFVGTGWDFGLNIDQFVFFDHYISIPRESSSFPFFMLAVGIVAGIPVLILIFLGLKMVFNFKSDNSLIFLTATILWIFGITLLATTGALMGLDSIKGSKNHYAQEARQIHTDTLYISLSNTVFEFTENSYTYIYEGNRKYIKSKKSIYGEPWLNIKQGKDEYFKIVARKETFGLLWGINPHHIDRQIDYKWEVNDTAVILDPYFHIGKRNRWRLGHLSVTIYVPEKKVIYVEKKIDKLLTSTENNREYLPFELGGYFWQMKSDSLIKGNN